MLSYFIILWEESGKIRCRKEYSDPKERERRSNRGIEEIP
jgi:hypothetical protein